MVPHSSSTSLWTWPCRQHTHTSYLTHTMVRPPIKSKVVCFYWSFALTSGLSFWRLYLSVSSWKSFVDNAQCFQLGENQTPGALAIFPPPQGPPSLLPLFVYTPRFSTFLLFSLSLSSLLQENGVCLFCKLQTQNEGGGGVGAGSCRSRVLSALMRRWRFILPACMC